MSEVISGFRDETAAHLRAAIHRNKIFSRTGLSERAFTLAFRNLVYAQIWEDPVVDMEALAIQPSDHLVTIASGGCNVMSYLSARPAHITALDLNSAHIALNNLKRAAAQHLPSYASFFNFFGRADLRGNIKAYHQYISPHLDEATRRYWDGRGWNGQRRINMFAKGFYRYGLLGRFIGLAHGVARLNGCKPDAILNASGREEQRQIFNDYYAPVFDRRFVRWMIRQPASLYGLGIPPAQYTALAGGDNVTNVDAMAHVLRTRLEKLICNFDIKDNYFAWQAFSRGYENVPSASVPPYLEKRNFESVRCGSNRVDIRHQSVTQFLRSSGRSSVDCVVLLDAQDWMNDEELTDLWSAITFAAKPGARVIFRTAADERLLPGKVGENILARWTYHESRSRELHALDRSSIYGMFHLYSLSENDNG